MNVLMYPLGTEDDFPDEFCAIRQGSGEHWFYTPVGEDASWMLFRALADNAKLRELCAGLLTGYECGYGELCKGCTWDGIGESKTFSCLPRAKARELGVEVDG